MADPAPESQAAAGDALPLSGSRTGRAIATILGWHLLVAVAFAGWVLTWPEEVDAGGDFGLTMSRRALAFLLAAFVVVPGLCLSVAIGCGVLAALRRRWHGSSLAIGTVAAVAGMGIVAAALAGYAALR